MGCAEGLSPFAGSLRMSLRYNCSPLPGQEERQGASGIVEGVFEHPANGTGKILRRFAPQNDSSSESYRFSSRY